MCRLFFRKAAWLLLQLLGLLKAAAAVSLFWAATCGLCFKIHDDKNLKSTELVRVLIDR